MKLRCIPCPRRSRAGDIDPDHSLLRSLHLRTRCLGMIRVFDNHHRPDRHEGPSPGEGDLMP